MSDRVRDDGTQQHAEDSADRGQRDCFERELQEDVALARADGLAHADFARALGNGDQHDVHHSDAAHDQCHAGHRKHKNEDRAGDLVPDIRERVLGEDGEIIGLVRRARDADAAAVLASRLRLRHVGVRCRLHADEVLLEFGMQLVQRGQREIDLVVVGIFAAAECALDRLRSTPITSNN